MILLSPPDVDSAEREMVIEALDSGWVAPLGPMVDRFEQDFAKYVGAPAAAALSSGTAALHLALVLNGVGPGDEVVVPSFTFVATANAVTYVGAKPVFIDSELDTWNMDPVLLDTWLLDRAASGRLPAAIIVVDLYGQCAQYDKLEGICSRFEVPLIADAAEALGASWMGRSAGTFGHVGAFSFNGNKLITTSGGGMLVGEPDDMDHVRRLASQAREPGPHYIHREIGFNYRLSNVLAAVGVAQLQKVPRFLDRRRRNRELYEELLSDIDGLTFMPRHESGVCNNWLTTISVDPSLGQPASVCAGIEEHSIEARPVWNPMHMQPVFAENEMIGGAVSEQIASTSLCLPSGSALTDENIDQVVAALRTVLLR